MRTATNYKEALNLRYEPARFNERENAFSFASHAVKAAWVMLGCDGKFWVVCPADASRLYKLGYEYAI